MRWCALLLTGLLLAPPSAGATERLIRTFGTDHAPPVHFIRSLAQDPAGFLWIGTSAGLIRYDGREMEAWGPNVHDQEVPSLAASPFGEVVCTSWDGRVFEVRGPGLKPIAPPGGFSGKARMVDFDRDGALIVATAAGLHRRGRDGVWSILERPEDESYTLILGGAAPLVAVTPKHAWRLGDDGVWTQLGTVEAWPVHLSRDPDGRVLVLTHSADIIPFGDERGDVIPPVRAGRGLSVAFRGDTMWVSGDRHLTAYRPGEAPEVLDNRHGIWSGGPLLVDHEQSLWLGNNTGLHHFPEPDTRAYSDLDGLPSAHVRFLEESDGRIVVSAWQGLGWIDGPTVHTYPGVRVNSRICADGRDRVWGMGYVPDVDGAYWVASSRATTETFPLGERTTWVAGCGRSPTGSVWLVDAEGISETVDEGPPVRRSDRPEGFGPHTADHNLVVRKDGRMMVTAGPIACQALERDVRAGTPTWTCSELLEQRSFGGLEEAYDGAMWAAAVPGGVFREVDGGWERLEATDRLHSRWISGLQRSDRGGIWLLGHGVFVRVADEGHPGTSFDVLESVGNWEGLVGVAPLDLVEGSDGTLWVASEMGVTRIPRSVVRSDLPVPEARLASARVDGRLVDPTAEVQVPPGAAVDLRFAALSYRDPGMVLYRFRSGPDRAWSVPRERPELLLVDPAPGHHIVEVVASLDGEQWSPVPARFALHALPPWYRDPRFLIGLLGALALTLGAAWQLRLQQLLRVERLRTQVAMDLHDEVGSGLGSIGLLAGTAALVPDDAREEILDRIVDTSAELGRSLSAIVWSLRTGSSDLRSLVARLVERGGALFPGGDPTLVVDVPEDLPARAMEVAVIRTVLLVGLEAMHNAARHSGGSEVRLTVRPRSDHRWSLAIEDNGRGIEAPSDALGGGYGLGGMRRRADEVGATLTLSEPPGGGTRVELIFRLRGPG